MKMRNRATALVAASLAMLAIGVPLAAAAQPGQVVKVGSKLWMADVGYQGKVRAGNPNCVEGREVLVKANGVGTIARATTDVNGVWKVKRSNLYPKLELPAKVYAVAPQVFEGTAGTIYNCLSAVSRTVTIPASAAEPGQIVRVVSNLWIADVGYQGRIRAEDDVCVSDRRILVKADGLGVIVETTTDANGFWKVDAVALYDGAGLPSKFYAVAPQVFEGTAGPIFRCLKSKSRTVAVG